jgi:hypothetical protein
VFSQLAARDGITEKEHVREGLKTAYDCPRVAISF